jgi:NAD(P)H-flavin reductase
MVYLFGIGEVALSYSGNPADPATMVHTVRAAGTVTRALTRLRRGAAVGVRGPYGSAWPLDAAVGRDVIVVAGGIGLAPLRPVLYDVLRQRARYGRVVVLHGARDPRDLLYARELAGWRARFDVEVRAIVDAPGPGWQGDVGAVTKLVAESRIDAAKAVAMICGPEVMLRFAVRELAKIGVANRDMWVSMERNMRCAVGWCGHCQLGPAFVCKDGPVFRLATIAPFFGRREM